jgi:hypothetical protein
MNDAKLTLSPEEFKLVSDPGVILTKNSVMEKVIALLAQLSEGYAAVWPGEPQGATDGAPQILASPKISRGENYRGLPWVMLDYPRFFGREDVFAIRTMFWWGHGFSVTLHLKGRYRERWLPVLRGRWAELAAAGFHVGVSADEWRHEHAPDNYGVMGGAGDLITEPGFLKLSAAVSLHRWDDVQELLMVMFKTLIGVLF